MTADLDTRVMAANPAKDEQIERLFGDDASRRLLREIRDRRVTPMPNRNQQTREAGSPPHGNRDQKPRGWLVALSAAAVVIVVIGLVALLQDRDDGDVASEPPATTIPATTAIEAASPTDPVAIVESSIEAYNAGDVETWLRHFTEDATVFGETPSAAAEHFGAYFAADSRLTVTDECLLDDVESEHDVVVCPIQEVNSFHGAGGIVYETQATFLVTDQGLILRAGPPDFGYVERRRFNSFFWRWIEDTHPDVHEQIRLNEGTPGSDDTLGRTPETPESMRGALEYVDEFVAQSDEFPIDNGA